MTYLIEGKKDSWQVVLGLEVHAQISSKSKLFSVASTNWGSDPNTQVELVDCGMPGALPVINEYCVDQAVLTGLSLNAEIKKMSIFDRKNYFYPDLPQGYQISQFEHPIVGRGHINIEIEGKVKKIDLYDPLINKEALEKDLKKNKINKLRKSYYDIILIAVSHDCFEKKLIEIIKSKKENSLLINLSDKLKIKNAITF